jgi:hypothetical protein
VVDEAHQPPAQVGIERVADDEQVEPVGVDPQRVGIAHQPGLHPGADAGTVIAGNFAHRRNRCERRLPLTREKPGTAGAPGFLVPR